MATAVMQPQGCMSPHEGLMGAIYRPVKSKSKSPPRKKSGQEKKRPLNSSPEADVSESRRKPGKNRNLQRKSNGKEQVKSKNSIVMGQVTILKRGQTVENISHAMGRLGVSPPKAEFVARWTRSEGFEHATSVKASKAKPRSEEWAGPGFANSPAPSSLPLPKFPFRNAAAAVEERCLIQEELPEIDRSATRDLRRLLGLL